jgi:hypothetical protein
VRYRQSEKLGAWLDLQPVGILLDFQIDCILICWRINRDISSNVPERSFTAIQ